MNGDEQEDRQVLEGTLKLLPPETMGIAFVDVAGLQLSLPGKQRGLGVDAILGLVPILGDLLGQAIAMYIIWEARQLGVSKVTLARAPAAGAGVDETRPDQRSTRRVRPRRSPLAGNSSPGQIPLGPPR